MQNPHISINFLCVLHKKNGIVHDTVFSHTLRRNYVFCLIHFILHHFHLVNNADTRNWNEPTITLFSIITFCAYIEFTDCIWQKRM